eukprot:8574203-Pyramimonas_sp.AAC.1
MLVGAAVGVVVVIPLHLTECDLDVADELTEVLPLSTILQIIDALGRHEHEPRVANDRAARRLMLDIQLWVPP